MSLYNKKSSNNQKLFPLILEGGNLKKILLFTFVIFGFVKFIDIYYLVQSFNYWNSNPLRYEGYSNIPYSTEEISSALLIEKSRAIGYLLAIVGIYYGFIKKETLFLKVSIVLLVIEVTLWNIGFNDNEVIRAIYVFLISIPPKMGLVYLIDQIYSIFGLMLDFRIFNSLDAVLSSILMGIIIKNLQYNHGQK